MTKSVWYPVAIIAIADDAAKVFADLREPNGLTVLALLTLLAFIVLREWPRRN